MQEVLSHMQSVTPGGNGQSPAATGGVFETWRPPSGPPSRLSASSSAAAWTIGARRSPASAASASSRPKRSAAMELEETKIGRLDHKIEKLKIVGEKIPGVEFLQTDAFSGENGITLTEYAPFGVIGVITPVTHSLPTLACNAINMLAAGNALVCNPHPSGDASPARASACSTRRSTTPSASTT